MLLFAQVTYKYESGLFTRLHKVVNTYDGNMAYENEGYPCKINGIDEYLVDEELDLKYLIHSRNSEIGIDFCVFVDSEKLASLYEFVNRTCESALKEHINKCVKKSDCLFVENLESEFKLL